MDCSDAMSKSILRWIFRACFRLEVKGMKPHQKRKNSLIIIANHASSLDAALISACIRGHFCVIDNRHNTKCVWRRLLLFFTDIIVLDPDHPMSVRQMIIQIKKKHRDIIYLQNQLTTGAPSMRIFQELALVADKTETQILPVMITGIQYAPFSILHSKVRIQLFPKVTLSILPQVQFNMLDKLRGKKWREAAGTKLHDVISNMLFESKNLRRTLFQSLLDARAIHGGCQIVAEDAERKPITYTQLIMRSFLLCAVLKRYTDRNETVGVLLPNMVSTLICFFGLQAFGCVPAMLNYSSSKKNLLSACKTAAIDTVITSRQFILAAKLTDWIAILTSEKIKIFYLEDLARQISVIHKTLGMLATLAPRTFYYMVNRDTDPEKAAVILFTSGSEDVPKGVVLSHQNIQANRFQVSSCIDLSSNDIVFNALPVFHSFGLTGGTLLPVLSGLRTFLYPSPLHYKIIPRLIDQTNATLLFGTDTFLAGYARFAHPHDFQRIRYVFAGAEKLREETRQQWANNFGVTVFEGYGTTETAPILSLNTPMHQKIGTVGRFMPGIRYQLAPVPGIQEGGRLQVAGPNIMKGYYLPDRPAVLRPPEGGWYDTGDIASIDEMGYLTIKGRIKRFAKVGGEMVSLAAVESYISRLWPEYSHAATHLPDPKKGEQIILVTTNPKAKRETLIGFAKKNGINELSIPKIILRIDEIPVLSTGKVDYVTLRNWAEAKLSRNQKVHGVCH